jgi:putative Holliday junction resolvase
LLRTGRRLAVDVGQARIGLAISDYHAIIASPLLTVSRTESLEESVASVLAAGSEAGELLEIYVGIPINLKGESTASTKDAFTFAVLLQEKTNIPVLLIDERLTTSIANQQLKEIGKSQRDARSTIDQMAAVAILEYAFQVETNTGNQPGVSLEEWRATYE